MPRLTLWAWVASGLSSALYATYHYVYVPSLTTKREMELFVEAEKALLLDVAQRLHRLRNAACTLNVDRLVAFCESHLLRDDIFKLPLRLQSAYDKAAMLKEVSAIQSSQCLWLRFRDSPLSRDEMWMSCIAYVLHWIAFRLVFPCMLQVAFVASKRGACDAHLESDGVQRVPPVYMWMHDVAAFILQMLEIDVEMTVDVPQDSSLSSFGAAAHFKYWIEEVAFWAAENNPWIAAPCDKISDSASQLSVATVRVHSGSDPIVELAEDSSVWNTQALTQALSEKYPVETVKELASAIKCPKTRFGYPPALRQATASTGDASSSHHPSSSQLIAPVAITGSEKVMYAGEPFAVSDTPPKFTSKDRYLELMKAQYNIGPGAPTLPTAAEVALRITDDMAPRALRENPLALPSLAPEAVWNVFGGRDLKTTSGRRTVYVRVGSPVSYCDLPRAWMQNYYDLVSGLQQQSRVSDSAPTAAASTGSL